MRHDTYRFKYTTRQDAALEKTVVDLIPVALSDRTKETHTFKQLLSVLRPEWVFGMHKYRVYGPDMVTSALVHGADGPYAA